MDYTYNGPYNGLHSVFFIGDSLKMSLECLLIFFKNLPRSVSKSVS